VLVQKDLNRLIVRPLRANDPITVHNGTCLRVPQLLSIDNQWFREMVRVSRALSRFVGKRL
jgi:hypothetical protein